MGTGTQDTREPAPLSLETVCPPGSPEGPKRQQPELHPAPEDTQMGSPGEAPQKWKRQEAAYT